MIIIEGIDNSGKSTLARFIGLRLGQNPLEGEGPPKYPGEMQGRVRRYMRLPPETVMVRHPCVSQPIYGIIRNEEDLFSREELADFYGQGHIFVYCDPGSRGLKGHVEREGVDTPEHLRAIHERYDHLLLLYREWAVSRAHIIYRIGDDPRRITRMLSATQFR